MSRIRRLVQLHIVLMAVLIVYSIVGYTALPDRYPVHFNLQGEPDRWEEKGSLEYWLLPVVAVVVGCGLLILLGYPHAYNFAQKEQVLRWPPEKRTVVYEKLKEMLLIIAAGVDIIFLAVQHGIVESASTKMNIPIIAIFGPVLAMPAIAIYYLVHLSRLVERTESELKVTGWAPEHNPPE